MLHARPFRSRINRHFLAFETCEPRILLATATLRASRLIQEGTALAVASSQGGELLQFPGTTGQKIEATFTLSARLAKYRSEVGLYRVDDSSGRIGTLSPGQRGYAVAALDRRTVLFLARQGKGAVTQVELANGDLYGTYLIQNSTSANFLARRLKGHAPQAFFSFKAANVDKFQHVRQSSRGVLSFEDLKGGGDRDFNDVIVSTAYTIKAGGTPGAAPDTTPPEVMISSPVNGLLTVHDVTVVGQAADDKTGVSTVAMRLVSPGTSASSLGYVSIPFDTTTATFRSPLNLKLDGSADGNYSVFVHATDKAGNTSTDKSVSFILDTTAPTVTVTDATGSPRTNQNVTISGMVHDALSGVKTLTGHVDAGTDFTVPFDSTGNFRLTTSLLLDHSADGVHTVTFVSMDTAGNHSTPSKFTFTLDTTAPVVTISAPTGTPLVRTNPVVTGTVTDAGSGVKSLQAATDGGAFVDVPFTAGSWSFTPAGTKDGPHSVVFLAKDNVGNDSSPVTLHYTLDATAPTVTLSGPAANLLTNAAVTVSGQAADNLSGVATVEAQVDSGAFTSIAFDASGHFSFPLNLPLDGTADGQHSVHFRATDKAGNVSTPVNLTFTLDATAPMIVITSPAPGQSGRTDVTVVGRVTDNLSGVASLQARIDAATTIAVSFDVSGNYTFTTSLPRDGSADGAHTVHLQATDHAGNVSPLVDLAFSLDTTPPRIVITQPSGSPLTNQNLLVTGTVSDNLSGVKTLQARVDNATFVNVSFNASGAFTFTTTIPLDHSADGLHSIAFQASDQVGNVSGLTSVGFTLDTTAPAVTIALDPASDSAPVGDDQTTTSIVTFDGQTEPNLPVTLVETGANATADALGKFTFAGIALTSGGNVFHVRATDSAGNVGSTFRTITRIAAACVFNDLTGWTIDNQGGSTSGHGTAAVAGDRVVIREGDSFHVALEHTFVIPAGATSLSFDYADLSFDTSSVGTIKDAFEASLLDSSGQSLVHTIGTGRDAFFNITEGTNPALGSEATLSGQTVALNLSGVFAGTTATLVLRLVNNDTDHNTSVAITCVDLPAGGIAGSTSLSVAESGTIRKGVSEVVSNGSIALNSAATNISGVPNNAVGNSFAVAAAGFSSQEIAAPPTHAKLFVTTNYYDTSLKN